MSRLQLPYAITLGPGTSRANHTGSWRTQRPIYVEREAPCGPACPAGERPRTWLAYAKDGDLRAAFEAIVRENPLPAVMGRACYHPCETACNRAEVDGAVGIHAVERLVGDAAIRERWPVPPSAHPRSGKRVLVVGSGPSGLAAAYHLTLLGHEVTLREAAPALGGMMRYGIPRYRLPREVLDAEIARIVALGVRVETSTPVANVARAKDDGAFDASFAAVGAHVANRVDIPTPDVSRIVDALALLGEEPPRIGRHVLVYGGGNTAMDAARVAKRLGAEDTCIVYRRTRAKMPAHAFELQDALDEGIKVRWLSTITRMHDGHAFLERMELAPDGTLRATGELEPVDADTVILAVGENVDLDVVRAPGVAIQDRVVAVDPHMMTGHAGLFCGGDMVQGPRSIAVAVGHGAKAARAIDAWLAGRTLAEPVRLPLAPAASLNSWYFDATPPATEPVLAPMARAHGFAEVHRGLDEAAAEQEAARCMSCGACFECDNCYAMCPDNAIVKLGPARGFTVDYDFCKGCGICASECPCGAIELAPEVG